MVLRTIVFNDNSDAKKPWPWVHSTWGWHAFNVMVGGFNRKLGQFLHELVSRGLQHYMSGTLWFTYLTTFFILKSYLYENFKVSLKTFCCVGLKPLHTRDWEPVTITLEALSLVEKAELVQVRFTLRLRDQWSMWMQDGCKVYMDSYMASNGSCFMVT